MAGHCHCHWSLIFCVEVHDTLPLKHSGLLVLLTVLQLISFTQNLSIVTCFSALDFSFPLRLRLLLWVLHERR